VTKPEVENLAAAYFPLAVCLTKNTSPEEEKQEAETTSNVQVQNNIGNEEQADDALLSGEEVMHSDKAMLELVKKQLP
jgi:exodeoxyribonuclease VIII